MPTDRVHHVLREEAPGSDPYSAVMAVARRLQTRFRATAWHLANLGFLTEDERDELIDQAAAARERAPPVV